MLIKYLGPSDAVNVEPYGPHRKDEDKEYPDQFGAALLATSKRQRFEVVPVGNDPNDTNSVADKMTVAQLTEVLGQLKVAIPTGAKKADLVELYTTATAAKE